MEKLYRKLLIPSIISSIMFTALGLLIFMNPATTLEVIAKIIGFTIIGLGIIGVFQYLKNRKEASFSLNLVYVITTIILGIIMIYKYQIVSSIIPIIIGIWICFRSFIKLRMAILLKNMDNGAWFYILIISILSLILGVFLLFNPFAGALLIVKTAAVLLIIYSIFDIIEEYAIIRYLK
ncbi:MAG: DUF308 domain-containing protein [Clostridia bacterium]|nr:DUF308 domain-containing protein [Clostridia bacterium]MDD4375717.1 DUF308 domain-containing protein [Clostridia bacterium]